MAALETELVGGRECRPLLRAELRARRRKFNFKRGPKAGPGRQNGLNPFQEKNIFLFFLFYFKQFYFALYYFKVKFDLFG